MESRVLGIISCRDYDNLLTGMPNIKQQYHRQLVRRTAVEFSRSEEEEEQKTQLDISADGIALLLYIEKWQ